MARRKVRVAADELDGPLARFTLTLVVAKPDRVTSGWIDTHQIPGFQFTVVKNRDVIEVLTNQPALEIDTVTTQALMRLFWLAQRGLEIPDDLRKKET